MCTTVVHNAAQNSSDVIRILDTIITAQMLSIGGHGPGQLLITKS